LQNRVSNNIIKINKKGDGEISHWIGAVGGKEVTNFCGISRGKALRIVIEVLKPLKLTFNRTIKPFPYQINKKSPK
jgi:hypothetical protein